MSLANLGLIYNLALLATPILDNQATGPASAQTTALPVAAEAIRVTSSAANGSLILRSIKTGEASTMTFVINDSANTIVVFPSVGESLNGTTNASISIAAGVSGLFVFVPQKLGGPDWRGNTIA